MLCEERAVLNGFLFMIFKLAVGTSDRIIILVRR